MNQQLTLENAGQLDVEKEFTTLRDLEQTLHQGGSDFDQKIHLVLQSLESIQRLKQHLDTNKTATVHCLNPDQSLTPFE